MGRIIYPAALQQGDTIAITAPSSGVQESRHHLLAVQERHLNTKGLLY